MKINVVQFGCAWRTKCFVIYFMYRSSLWFKYGLMKNDQTLIVVNSTGAILCFMYMLLYYIYTLQKVNNFQVLFELLISNYQLQFPVSYQYLICCSWIFYVWIGNRWEKYRSINNRKWVPKTSTDIAVPIFVPVVFEGFDINKLFLFIFKFKYTWVCFIYFYFVVYT